MSSLPGYPNVGGLTGINVRLKLMHNNTSFTENKASGTIIDDQSTGFVPEQMGNALSFAKLDVPTNDVTKGVMVRGDHFFAKNDYHLQIALAAVEEIKLNAGESVWLEVESYEKEFSYKHYISDVYFQSFIPQLNASNITHNFIRDTMGMEWGLTSTPAVSSRNEIIAAYEDADAHYRFRGNYGGPVEIVEGNESFCNLDQDFVHLEWL